MRAKREYRDRDQPQVAVLDALADRGEEGMTVLELRSRVDADIDRLEGALADLKEDGLIEVKEDGDRTVILPQDHAVGTYDPGKERGLLDKLREWLP
ncbi:MarR family transcriptional regulator [Halobacteriales archaeon QS_1_68_17]|jgi:DNA-binding transcriptional ArsR family regulator|nr:MAG: MarR family transcriptional regulator [Halobacteriales archaeon QS_1_68_17]